MNFYTINSLLGVWGQREARRVGRRAADAHEAVGARQGEEGVLVHAQPRLRAPVQVGLRAIAVKS